MSETKKTLDVDIRERVEAACRAIMADHPEVEAVGVMFLSRHLAGVLAGMIVGANGPRLRPDQNVRLFEVWTRLGMQLLENNQRDVQSLDQLLAQYARRLTDAKTEAEELQPQLPTRATEDGREALACTKAMDRTTMSSLDEVIKLANVPDTWDVLIVGDGAGCWWDRPCGWGCTLIDRHLDRRRAFDGGMSSGSIAIAELMPTVHAMLWYDEFQGKDRRAKLGRATLDVHVVTDSQTTANHWATLSERGPKARKIRRKRPLWEILLQLERAGYIFHFHWIPRGTVGLNTLADELAGVARDAIAGVKLKPRDKVERTLDSEIYSINASA